MGQILAAEARAADMKDDVVYTAPETDKNAERVGESVGADIEKRLASCIDKLRLPETKALSGKLAVYLRMLQDWNTRVNLTRVIETDAVIDRHFIESLSVLGKFGFRETGKLIDVGTGAGFPGLVLAMALPGWKVTLLDAREKRLRFIKAVCEATETRNVTILHARAEDAGRDNRMRGAFDVAAARAVARLDALCGLLLPFVKQDGLALCWKGPAWLEERDAANIAAERLGGEIEEPVDCAAGILPERTNLIIPIRKKRTEND